MIPGLPLPSRPPAGRERKQSTGPEKGRCPPLRREVGAHGDHVESVGKQPVTMKSVLCLPVCSGDRVLGSIYVDNRFQAAAFTDNHLRWLEILAGQTAVAIRNAQLFEENRDRNRDLEIAQGRLERLNLELTRR